MHVASRKTLMLCYDYVRVRNNNNNINIIVSMYSVHKLYTDNAFFSLLRVTSSRVTPKRQYTIFPRCA